VSELKCKDVLSLITTLSFVIKIINNIYKKIFNYHFASQNDSGH